MRQLLLTSVVLVLLGTGASAATWSAFTTNNDAGGIELSGPPVGLALTSIPATYSPAPGSSQWVWDGSPDVETLTWTYTIDLSGFLASTASLSGLWGVDNTGSVALNSTTLTTLPTVQPANFQSPFDLLSATGYAGGFVDGVNTITFTTSNAGGPGGFAADLRVTATPVPLPAGLPLALAGLGALAALRAARRRRA